MGTKETIPQAKMTEVKNALAQACGQVDPTATWWGQCQKIAAELIRATPGVTAQEVLERAERFRRRYPGYDLTLQPLANHWGSLGATAVVSVKPDKLKIEALQRMIDYHPANPDSVTNNPALTTDAQRAELRDLRRQLRELITA